MSSPVGEITLLLSDLQQGNAEAGSKLMPLVYAQLRQIAAHHFRSERPDHTLQPTALVHEAYLRLVKPGRVPWKDRAHFFRIAARAMRQILVEWARKRNAEKRGGGQVKINLDKALVFSPEEPGQFLALEGALIRLKEFAPRQSRIVELRLFGGLSVRETAEALGVGITTVKSEWHLAKAWLRRELENM
jgi:RNA polymerase sigma-70 factor, ECF subfamily